jgi:protein-tyrosine phosphatase
MIDLHTHILPGVDDGPADMSASLDLARALVAAGIDTAVATPHAFDGIFNVSGAVRDQALARLRTMLAHEGIPLTVLPGAECRVFPGLGDAVLQDPDSFTLNRTGSSLLLELPDAVLPPGLDEFLFEMRMRGLTVVLVHPERNPAVVEDWRWLGTWVEGGGLVQLTAASVTGAFGLRTRWLCRRLIRRGWVHLLSSDAHGCTGARGPQHLPEAVDRAARVVGRERALDMVTTTPARLLGIPWRAS